RLLGQRGLHVPDDTWFVGCEHDTTTDEVTWYDLEDVPPTHAAPLDALRATVETACRRNAHERCRRLPLAPRHLDEAGALRHVRRRAVDPSQPRPELGHTNDACCVVGRR